MAIFSGKNFKGLLGGLAFRQLDGRTIVQTAPGKGGVRQTVATKERSIEFGIASATNKAIRICFNSLHERLVGKKMPQRLQNIVSTIIRTNSRWERGKGELTGGDVGLLSGFNFNANPPFEKVFLPQIESVVGEDETLKVIVPSFIPQNALVIPFSASECVLRLQVIAFDFAQEVYKEIGEEEASFPVNGERVEGLSFTFEAEGLKDTVIMAGIALEFYTPARRGSILLNTNDFSPCLLLKAYNLENDHPHTSRWYDMPGYRATRNELKGRKLK